MSRFRSFYHQIKESYHKFMENVKKLLKENYKKLVREIKKTRNIPHYDYKKVIEQIKAASYPASLGMINLGLYQYVKGLEVPEPLSPDTLFLISSILFFLVSVLIGLGLEHAIEEPLSSSEELKQSRYRQAFIIVMFFAMAIVFDLLGLIFIVAMHSTSV